ncbi:MAG: histidine phosphatase family protein [Sphingomonadales bacterium]|nr:histidine phosphatase family protein [Sphingomonadales bacterium]
MTQAGRWYICRHGETVFNAVRRLQGDAPHTPLTRTGFAQADAIGAALAERLGNAPALTLWASDTGRALQTLAVIAEHLALDWHAARRDPRLREIDVGSWGGRYYSELSAERDRADDAATGLFTRGVPGGESYQDVARRLGEWIAATRDEPGDRLIVMHGMSSRVLRGLLLDLPEHGDSGAPIAPGLSQGSLAMIENGRETLLVAGAASAPR